MCGGRQDGCRCDAPEWQGSKRRNVVLIERLLGVGGFDMDRGVELTMVNVNIHIQRTDVGGGSVPGKVDGIVTVQQFKKSSEGVSPMGPK